MAKIKKRMGPEPVAQNKLDAIGIDAICTEVAECVTFREISSKYGVSLGVLSVWLSKHPEQYARSLEARAEKMADDILSIADDGFNDTYEDKDGTHTNYDVIARSRLRVDARKWLASKMFPKRYGDKVEVESRHSGAIEVSNTHTFDADALALLDKIKGG